MYRQGDLLFVKADLHDRLVKRFVEEEYSILLHGEATGHSHKLEGAYTLYGDKDNGDTYFKATDARITHDEHDTIEIAPGVYKMVRQREYTPEEIKYVID